MSVITVKKNNLEYLVAEGICVPHCFTTRLGGVSKGHLASLNIGIRRGDAPENVAENFRILGEAVGFSLEDLVSTRQVHSDIVWQVGRAQRGTAITLGSSPECDALITNEAGTGLVIYTADCTPILLHDPVTGAVGAAHAGWKGTAAAIAEKPLYLPEDDRHSIGREAQPAPVVEVVAGLDQSHAACRKKLLIFYAAPSEAVGKRVDERQIALDKFIAVHVISPVC